MVFEENLIQRIDDYLKRLFPINRSITGDGVRETLGIIQEIIPIKIHKYKSGTQVYDWIIPDEWHIRDAWIADEFGNKIVDYKNSNLHIVNYSQPVDEVIFFEDFKDKLHYLDHLPTAIPYRTTYYNSDWGFCITKEQFIELSSIKGKLHVHIDTVFDKNGELNLGELVVEGKSKKEFLISTYLCHPSMANDNLSAVILTAFLADKLSKTKQLNYSYRIVFLPETIGAIAYCANNEGAIKKIDSGLVVATVGGPGHFGYKQSFNKDHDINYIIENVLNSYDKEFITYPFDIHGSDERQYSSIGFRINVASITKDKYYEYPFYHTSLDNLEFVKADQIYKSLLCYMDVIKRFDNNVFFKSKSPYCENMLSKHDLYPKVGGAQLPNQDNDKTIDARLWLLFYCDGNHSIETISREINIDPSFLYEEAIVLEEKKLLVRV